jgi:iron complex outermembrane receptor protein
MKPNTCLITRSAASLAVLTAAALLNLVSARAEDTPPPSAASIPTTADTTGEVVRMDAFNVSTSIGAYHEETSSMATKVPTDLKELASSLQILNATAIADRNSVTLQDIFQYVNGLTQSQQNVNGFTFRGIANSGSFTQNIEYDGLQGGTLKKGAQGAADVDNIEFLKGPNSVLYGQMRPGGLLNIVSKSPQAEQRLNLRASFFTYGGKYNNLGSVNGQAGVIDSTGPIDSSKHWLYRVIVDAESSPSYRTGDYDKLVSVYPSLAYQWNEKTSFTVKLELSQDRRRTDDGLMPIFTTGIAYGSNARWTTAPLNTVYQDPTDVSREKGEALATAFHTELAHRWTLRIQTRTVWHTDQAHEFTNNNVSTIFPKASFATLATTGLTRQYNNVINGHRYNYYDANIFGDIGPKSFLNTVLVGVGGGDEYFANQRFAFGPNVLPVVSLYHPILGQTPYPADGTKVQSNQESFTTFGAYVLDQIKIGNRIHFNAGTRYNQQSGAGLDVFNPNTAPYTRQFVTSETSQVGAVFDVTSLLSAYGSWSQSFVPNDVTSVDANGNSGFAPEQGLQYEGGLKFESADRKLFASAAAYWIKRTNVLVASGLTRPVTGQAILRLDGEQHSEGIEVEAQYQPLPYWQIQAGVALSKAFVAASLKNPQTVGDDLTNAPRGNGNFWSRYNIPSGPFKGLGLGTGVIYVGKYWGGDPTSAVYFPVPGYTRVDTAVYYKWRRYDLSLNVQNLFDRRFYLAVQTQNVVFAGDERKLSLSVATHF